MGNAQRKSEPRTGTGTMHEGPNLLEATRRMDLAAIKACVEKDPDCVHHLDRWDCNAMHICVGGSVLARPGGKAIFDYFLNETEINLLQESFEGLDPFDLALALNQEETCDLIEPFWHAQLSKRFPQNDRPKLSIVPTVTGPRGPQSGPK